MDPIGGRRVFWVSFANALLLLAAATVRGDPVSLPAGPAAGVFGEAGGLPTPDPSTGTLTHHLPFELPAARGLAQPALGLTYRSTQQDAEAGYGWSLDLPVIEAKPLSGWPGAPGNGAALEERFAFSGAALVAICRVGPLTDAQVPPCGAADELPSWAGPGWAYYRLQVEGPFFRFFLSPSRQTWRIQAKGGLLLELGQPLTRPTLSSPAIEAEDGVIYRWRLVRQIESARPQNLVVYRWRPEGSRGLLYLTDLWDTPRAAGPLGSVLLGLQDFAHHTQLTWEPHPFPISRYAHLDKARPDLRLVRVAVASATWDGRGPRQIVRLYRLGYYANRDVVLDPATQGPLFHHSFLRELRVEGHCRWVEDDHGDIPQGTECQALPPATFEYQGSTAYGGLGGLSSLTGEPPPGFDVTNQALPHLHSAAVVDFNRDGLPDVVQSWEAEPTCFNEPGRVRIRVVKKDGELEPQLWCHTPEGKVTLIGSARPMKGYLNRGGGPFQVQLAYQCLDAGDGSPGTLPGFVLSSLQGGEHLTSFLADQGAATLVGAYGDGALIWGAGDALFRPFRVVPALPDPSFCPVSGAPSWRWEAGSRDGLAWARRALGLPFHAPNDDEVSGPRWYADIDGDGLVDALGTGSGLPVGDSYRQATVSYTRQFGAGEPLPGGGTGPAQIPFSVLGAHVHSLVPRHHAPEGTRFFYTDVNGDGLVDLARLGETGPLMVRAGDGRGRFDCSAEAQPLNCVGEEYAASAGGGSAPWPKEGVIWPDRDERFVHDVTGDGLADIVVYHADDDDPVLAGMVRLWVNVDGRTFRCADPTTKHLTCVVGRVVDALHGTLRVDPHRVTFADMDANGIDDLVVLGRAGIFVVSLTHKEISLQDARAPRPGLLIRIRTGTGATTDIHYQTIQELMLEQPEWEKWTSVVPVVESVVTQIRTHNGDPEYGDALEPPWGFDRRVHYEYRDPTYDPWERRFAGFRKVRTRLGQDSVVDETTFWYGPCQREQIVDGCLHGSDDERDKARVGRAVRIDRLIPQIGDRPAQWLASTELTYDDRVLFDRARDVRYAPVVAVEAYAYDTERPVTFRLASTAGAGGQGDVVEHSPYQDERAPITRELTFDNRGNLQRVEERGRQVDGIGHLTSGAQSHDPVVVTWFGGKGLGDLPAPHRCDPEHWRCFVDQVSVTTPGDAQGGPQLERMYRFAFTPQGDLAAVDGWLAPGFPQLARSHAAGKPVAPPPAGASPPGPSKGGRFVRLAAYAYDPDLGGQTRIEGAGSPAPCTSIDYDAVFAHLPATIREHRVGCGTASLDSQLVFHRGLQSIVRQVEPTGAVTEVRYDPFGRPLEVHLPKPDDPDPHATVLGLSFHYLDRSPLSWARVTRHLDGGVEARSLRIVNGLGEEPLGLVEDEGGWVVEAWNETDEAGRVVRSHGPFFLAGDPRPILEAADTISIPSGTPKLEAFYDGYGRLGTLRESGSLDVATFRYRPFEVEMRDSEQSKPGAVGHVLRRYDGHGRLAAEVQVTAKDTLTWEPTWTLMGQPKQIRWRHAAGPDAIVRTFEYDSLGRLVAQQEPNTGEWRYAWDDAGLLVGTSDARGCGTNFHHDALGRLIGEDYSPCAASHAAYSQGNPATGQGLEVLYRYDTYEPGQVAAEPGFRDSAALAAGRLVAARDRGGWTRLSYDNRGRVRRIARRVALPAEAAAPSYATHWFVSRADYDAADRLVRRTTGVDVPELAPGGQSEETYRYTLRDQIQRVLSTYGVIVRDASYDADGRVRRISYGDLAGTQAAFEYDWRRQLAGYRLSRGKPALWTTAAPTYPLPDGSTTPTEILRYRYGYDDLGDLRTVEDLATGAWPPAAVPVKKLEVEYDDLHRVREVGSTYATASGAAPWASPWEPEVKAGDRRPVPLQTLAERVRVQTFTHDWMGNLIASEDDQSARYDRSLGAVTLGTTADGPHQLRQANGITAVHDAAGNLTELEVERAGTCEGPASRCAQWFVYDWDEAGQLVRARRWDFEGNVISPQPSGKGLPAGPPAWDLRYRYTLGTRVLKSARDSQGRQSYTLDVFDTLRLDRVAFDAAARDYRRDPERLRVRLGRAAQAALGYGGGAQAIFDRAGTLPRPAGGSPIHLLLELGDRLGSSAVTIDHASSELVERTTYQPYGAVESDFRPRRWRAHREDERFTGKEEDIEVGAVYFGARYYQPHLGRWLSADPLAIQGLATDPNPYAYVSGDVLASVDPRGLAKVVEVPGPCTYGPGNCLEIVEDPEPPQGGGVPEKPPKETEPPLREMKSFERDHAYERAPPDAGPHVNVANVGRHLWNGVVTDMQIVSSGMVPPLGAYHAYRLQDQKVDVPEEAGDLSELVAFGVSAAVPGPEGKVTAVRKGAIITAKAARRGYWWFHWVVVRVKGRPFEEAGLKALGAVPNRARAWVVGATATIPDAIGPVAAAEFKNVWYLWLSPQLKAQMEGASERGLTYVLVVSMRTKVSAPTVKAVEKVNGMIVRFDPATGFFHPYP